MKKKDVEQNRTKRKRRSEKKNREELLQGNIALRWDY